MDSLQDYSHKMNRRTFLSGSVLGLGTTALGDLLGKDKFMHVGDPQLPHYAPKAKRIVYLFQSGAPSQLDLFDYKPKLQQMFGQELPASIRGDQRVTGMTANQRSFPLAGTKFGFNQYGKGGVSLSEILPYHSQIADEMCVIRTMNTEAINHDPAITFIQTGSQQSGRPSFGSWMSYGLGSENKNLPAFCVLLSRSNNGDQPLYSKLWNNAFLPSEHQGVMFRSGEDPILYLKDPQGLDKISRRDMLDALEKLHKQQFAQTFDDDLNGRISQYEMAYRMQTSVPETLDVSKEPDWVFELYGENARKPGTFAANCLLARKLLENDVRFVQLYHQGWDQHGNLPNEIKKIAKDVDQPSAALVMDLKQRGLLEDTLVIWGGEFGRGCYSQGKLSKDNYGRDHHPRCYSIWMAGAGVKKGFTYGETDEFGYNIIKDPVNIHDFQATVMHLMGIDHERFNFKFQGRRYRLTDVEGKVVKGILS